MKASRLVRAARKRKGLTQRELAAKTRIAQPMISSIERGLQDPRYRTLQRIFRACDLEVDEENLERLARALSELHATLRGPREPVAFRLDARTLKAGLNFTFDTDYGPFDCLSSAAGGFDYEQLQRNADAMNLVGTNISVASLD